LLTNPKITKESKKLINPNLIIEALKKQPEVIGVTPNVSVNVFYNNGEAQVTGRTSGVNIEEQNTMFQLEQYIVEGKYSDLKANQNGIILGVGIAEKLNVRLADNISVTTAYGVSKVMKVVALLKTGVTNTDKTLSYTNISAAQQLNKQGASFITDIYVTINDYETAKKLIPKFKKELRKGTPIISYKYEMSLPLKREDKKNEIFIYTIVFCPQFLIDGTI
jgi:lipoprotein-releasing system permease protein